MSSFFVSLQKVKYTMKRYLTIILLCILAACALTSCEKDKSDEIVNTYADFVKSNYIGETTYAAFVDNLVTGSNNITLNSSSHIKAGLIGNLLHAGVVIHGLKMLMSLLNLAKYKEHQLVAM